MKLPKSVLAFLDPERADQLLALTLPPPEELRFRIGRPCAVLTNGVSYESEVAPVTAAELDRMLERAVKASFYAHRDELRHGYIHLSSGVRIGVCGTVYFQDERIAGIRSVSSLSVRIPNGVYPCADEIFSLLTKGEFHSTLIVSPPGFGKTTLLRSLIRRLSESGRRVAVADERGEIAAMSDRKYRFDLGPNTDVLSGGRKADTAMMLLRSMNPQILAFDEITASEDISMITQAAGCGVSLLATVHGSDRKNMQKRSLYRTLFDTGIFENMVQISMSGRERRYTLEKV